MGFTWSIPMALEILWPVGRSLAGRGPEQGVESRRHFYPSLKAGWIAGGTPEFLSCHLGPL